MSMRPSGDTARGLVFDDFVDKQVVHVSATSFRSGAELVSMSGAEPGCVPRVNILGKEPLMAIDSPGMCTDHLNNMTAS